MIGLTFDLYRHDKPYFKPKKEHLVNTTRLFHYEDIKAPEGRQYYALIASSGPNRSKHTYAMANVPKSIPVPVPRAITAVSHPGEIKLQWKDPQDLNIRFNVYRAPVGSSDYDKLNEKPLPLAEYRDVSLEAKVNYQYVVRSVNRRQIESPPSKEIICHALPIRKPVLSVDFKDSLEGVLYDGSKNKGRLYGNAKITDGSLDLRKGGYVTFPYNSRFDLDGKLTLKCRVKFDSIDKMPIIVSCGQWNGKGWFLQKLGSGFRWHVGGVDCDGGKAVVGEWISLVCVFDGENATLLQDGEEVASVPCTPNRVPWQGALFVGQYGAGPDQAYQVKGSISDVKIYRSTIFPKEIKEKSGKRG
jgi:hypothetical protein